MKKKYFLIFAIVMMLCVTANNFARTNDVDASFRKIYSSSYAYPEGLSGGQPMMLSVSDSIQGIDAAEEGANAAVNSKKYGYSDLAKRTNPSERQNFYDKLLKQAREVQAATFDVEAVDINGESCCILQKYSLSELQLTENEAIEVWVAFRNDYPEFYWLSNACITANDGMFCMVVYDEYASAQERKRCNALIDDAIAEYISLANKCNTKLEMAVAVHDELCKNIEYAMENGVPSQKAYAHNVMGAFENGYAVCEGYAKAYQYILSELGIENVYVTGTATSSGASENHAWNLVKLDDNRWYNIDVTWDDTSVSNKIVHYYFGMAKSAFAKTHTANIPDSDDPLYFLYDIPEESSVACSLVTLYKNGTRLGICYGIENAFAKMTDSEAEYTIELFENTQVFAMGGKTPSVKALCINGNYNANTGECDKIYVVADSLTVGSDITLKNIELTEDKSVVDVRYIDANGKTITFAGEKTQCNIDIKGNESCIVEILTDKKSSFGNVDVKNVVISSKSVDFGTSKCFAENITVKDGTKDIETKMLSSFSMAKTVKIPATVTFVASGAFDGNLLLESIIVDDNNKSYMSRDGILYGISKNETKLVRCPINKKCDELNLQDIASVENNAFKSVNGINTVVIRYGCSFIGENSFANISSDINLYLPSSVKSVAATAFYQSPKLTIYCKNGSLASMQQTAQIRIIGEYTYVFKDYDGKEICSVTDYENSLIIKPENPQRSSDETYEYEFSKWENYTNGMLLTKDCEFTACYDSILRKYEVKFLDAEGNEFSSAFVNAGSAVVLPKTPPEKASTEEFEYTFVSWNGYKEDEDNEMKVFEELVFTPVFEKTIRKYNYTFYDDDGETVISNGTLQYGEVIPVPMPPMKDYFDFDSWNGYTAGMTIKGDITFTASYELHVYKYTFYDDDEITVIAQGEIPYTSVIPLPDDPQDKIGVDGNRYVFSRWIGYEYGMQISEDVTFVAEYKINAFKYRFLNYDGVSVIKEGVIELGEAIPLPDGNPVRHSTKQYDYTFIGWDGYTQGMTISQNIDFVATYEESLRMYEYIFRDEDGNNLKKESVPYGTVITPPEYSVSDEPGFICEFVGWKDFTPGMVIEGNYIFYVEIKRTPLTCNVIFKNYDGSVFETMSVSLGDTIELPSLQPTRKGYKFIGWDGYTYGMTANDDTEFIAVFELHENNILSSVYKVDDGMIFGIEQMTTLADFKKNLKNEFEVRLYDKNGNEIKDDKEFVTTLTTVKLYSDYGDVLSEAVLAVSGDINGDGKITITDFVQIKSHLITGNAISNKVQLKAADISGDGKISITDFVQIKSVCLNN